jgi:hypothetical protein
MWHRLLDRIAPMVDEDLSVLDLMDGLRGQRADQDASTQAPALPAQR